MFFILTVAAAESAIGLAILVVLFRNLQHHQRRRPGLAEGLDADGMKSLYLLVPLAPLAGAIVAGLFGKAIGRAWSHRVTILGVLISFCVSVFIFSDVLNGNTCNGSRLHLGDDRRHDAARSAS